jgi:acyl-CoA thioesterase FadM
MAAEAPPSVEAPLAQTARRVTMRDVDAAGILYLAVPYAWHEEMWTGLLHETGHALSTLLAEGAGTPAVASSATYTLPVGLDAILQCRLFAEDIGKRSFGLRMEASLPGNTMALSVVVRHVWCAIQDGRLEAAPLPVWLRQILSLRDVDR